MAESLSSIAPQPSALLACTGAASNRAEVASRQNAIDFIIQFPSADVDDTAEPALRN
jgi:hypothetical protein